MCVAVNGTADRARSARPGFNSRDATVDGPSHESVDRQASVGADRCRIDWADVSTTDSDDDPAYADVGHEHIGASAKDCDRHVRIASDRDRVLQVAAVMHVEEPVGGAADLERGQRRQWRVAPNAMAPERGGKTGLDVDHVFNPSNADSCSLNAATASARVHSVNSIQSPGANCPAVGKSAVITVAIFGYPPVVWRSAISRIGWPDAGTCTEPSGVASESMSALAA